MGIFSSILTKIFPPGHPAVAAAGTADTTPTASTPAPATTDAPAAAAPADTPAAAAPAAAPVDVEQVLVFMEQSQDQKLNWRTSIVDLLKLLQLPSDLGSRKELATELKYTGDMNDSATMNVWLHKEVMTKLEENGGAVPASLKV